MTKERPSLVLESLAVLAVLTGLLCLTYWRFLLPLANPSSVFFRCDYWVVTYPFSLLGRQSVIDWTLPLWDPYSRLGGRPGMTENIRAYFYLPNIVSYVIGSRLSAETFQRFLILRGLLQIAFGGTGVYALMRRWTFRWQSALLAAITFSLSGLMQGNVHNPFLADGFSLIPWVLLSWEWFRSRPSIARFSVTALVVSQILFASYQNNYTYAFLLIVSVILADAVALNARWTEKAAAIVKNGAIAAAVFSVGVLIAMAQVLPSLRLVAQTSRSVTHGLEWSLSYRRLPYQIFEFFWPSFYTTTSISELLAYQNVTLYVGILPLFLIPLLLIGRWGDVHGKAGIRWLFITIPFAAMSFGGETRLHDLLYLTVPMFEYFRASNHAWSVALMGIAILSGISLDSMIASGGRRVSTGRIVRVTVGVLSISLVVLVPVAGVFLAATPHTGVANLMAQIVQLRSGFEHILGQIGQLLFWVMVTSAGLLCVRRYPSGATVMLSLVAFFDLSGHLGKQLLCNRSPVSPAVVFGENRVIDELRGLIATQTGPVRVRFERDFPQHFAAEHYKIFTTDGPTGMDLQEDNDTAFLSKMPAHPFANIAYEVTYHPLAGRAPIRDLVVTPDEEKRGLFADINAPDGPGLWPKKAGDHIFIYKNDAVFPRASFVNALKFVETASLESAYAANDLRSIALVTHDDIPVELQPLTFETTGAAVISMKYDTNAVTVDVVAPKNSLLVMSDTYFPGWRAYANGREVRLFRVNGKFRGVLVPAGASKLVLRYTAEGFYAGLSVSGLTLVAVLAACLVERKRRRGQEPS